MPLHARVLIRQLGILRAVLVEQGRPLLAQLLSTLADAVAEVLEHSVGHQEMRVFGPSVETFGQPDFVLAEGLAVRFFRVLSVGSSVADMAVQNNERGTVLDPKRVAVGVGQRPKIIGVMDVRHIPAVTPESCGDILAEGEVGLAFNGDLIVVIEPAQVRKLQVSGERGSLRRDTFHQVTVAAESPDVVIKKLKSGAVEMCSEPFPGNRHAHAVADSLAERAGCRFDACGQAKFRMSRSFAVDLAESL